MSGVQELPVQNLNVQGIGRGRPCPEGPWTGKWAVPYIVVCLHHTACLGGPL